LLLLTGAVTMIAGVAIDSVGFRDFGNLLRFCSISGEWTIELFFEDRVWFNSFKLGLEFS
jgi:hypothetical protein